MKIAVTGVGGGVGQSILKSLRESDYEVIALDSEVLAVGLYQANSSYLIPYANNDDYIPALLNICEKENVKLLFPGMDAELMPLSLNKKEFAKIGTTVVVSSPEIITISDNKLETYLKLGALNINVPKTLDLTSFSGIEIEFPVIIKQKVGGARSKNVYLVSNHNEYAEIVRNIGKFQDNYVVQKHIGGDEYTCGSITINGVCKGVIAMKRQLRNGDTYKCFSERNPIIEGFVADICNKLRPFGACNIQLKLENNVPYVFEINARCSGTTASRTLCGFNEPKMIADKLLKNIEPSYTIKEMAILRFLTELVVDNDSIANMKKLGCL